MLKDAVGAIPRGPAVSSVPADPCPPERGHAAGPEPYRCHNDPVQTGSMSQWPGPGQADARDSRAGSDPRGPRHRTPAAHSERAAP